MRKTREEKYEQPHEHDHLFMFLSFLATALIGYILTNHVALLGA